MVRMEDTRFVPPATVKVPCEPAALPTTTSRASHVPLDTVTCPTPRWPIVVWLLLDTTNCPPVTHTAPVDPARLPTERNEESVNVPPAIVSVPTEPAPAELPPTI